MSDDGNTKLITFFSCVCNCTYNFIGLLSILASTPLTYFPTVSGALWVHYGAHICINYSVCRVVQKRTHAEGKGAHSAAKTAVTRSMPLTCAACTLPTKTLTNARVVVRGCRHS